MKIILLQDVEKLGKRGDSVTVKDGFAFNYLIPQKIAIQYSEGNLKRFKLENVMYQKRMEKMQKEIEATAEAIRGQELSFCVKVHDDDKLYGSISEKDIALKLSEKGFKIERDQIVLKTPIKEVGEFHPKVKIKGGLEVEIKVSVKGEEENGT